jgi:hypothetical protein
LDDRKQFWVLYTRQQRFESLALGFESSRAKLAKLAKRLESSNLDSRIRLTTNCQLLLCRIKKNSVFTDLSRTIPWEPHKRGNILCNVLYLCYTHEEKAVPNSMSLKLFNLFIVIYANPLALDVLRYDHGLLPVTLNSRQIFFQARLLNLNPTRPLSPQRFSVPGAVDAVYAEFSEAALYRLSFPRL